MRTGGASFDAGVVVAFAARRGSGVEDGDAFGLAGFAALGFVLELFVVEKELFAGSEHEFTAAIDAGEYFVPKFH